MSELEKMADSSFLSRWSQRKREAKAPDAKDVSLGAEGEKKDSPAPEAEAEIKEEFDFSKLPKLEDIKGTTDITDFLRKGVPESVKNAALRKSWALDPTIRNYVNPALDYAYDWNTPGGVPGNSELAVGTDIAKMVLQIMGSGSTGETVESGAPTTAALPHNAAPEHAATIEDAAVQEQALASQQVRVSPAQEADGEHAEDRAASAAVTLPAIDEASSEMSAAQQSARRHGSAKPSFRQKSLET